MNESERAASESLDASLRQHNRDALFKLALTLGVDLLRRDNRANTAEGLKMLGEELLAENDKQRTLIIEMTSALLSLSAWLYGDETFTERWKKAGADKALAHATEGR